jgi:uncharacterized protein YndB with AHSA1/START domain
VNTETQKTRDQKHTIEIDAPAEAVWKALTDAEEVTRWYAGRAEIDTREGGRYFVSWGEGMDGTGKIIKLDPGKLLRITREMPEKESVFMSREMIEAVEAPIVEEYVLESDGNKTTLRLVTSGIPTAAVWDGFYDGTSAGWGFYFRAMRHYLENHLGTPRQKIEIMIPVRGTIEDTWNALTGPQRLAAHGAIGGIPVGQRYTTTSVDGDILEGEVILSKPPRAVTATAENLNNALFSLGVQDWEAAGTGVWMALFAYGVPQETLDGLNERWTKMVRALATTA